MMLKLRLLVIACITIVATIAVWTLRPTHSSTRTFRTDVKVHLDELRRADRTTAETIVTKLSKLDRPHLRELANHIGDENPNIKRGVALALANAPSLEIETAKALQQGLRDPAVVVREQCIRAIGNSEWKGPDVAALMAGLFDDLSGDVRSVAAIALGEQGEAARAHVPALNKMMLDDWGWVGATGASACRRLGKIAVGSEPGLLRMIEIGDADEAIEALAELQSPKALDILIDMIMGTIRSGSLAYRLRVDKACRAIGKFGEAGRPAMFALKRVCDRGSGLNYRDRSYEDACKAAARDAIVAVDPEEAKAMGIERKRE